MAKGSAIAEYFLAQIVTVYRMLGFPSALETQWLAIGDKRGRGHDTRTGRY